MAIEFGPKDRYRTYGVPSLDLPFADRKSLVDIISGNNLITFTRSTTGTYVGSDGLIKTAAVNEPRFDHNPLTRESLGLLVEEARTNVIKYSQSIGTSPWTIYPTITSTTTDAPDGSLTATTVSGITPNGFLSSGISTGGTCTWSIYARSSLGAQFYFLYWNGNNIVSSTFTATAKWQRFSWTSTSGSMLDLRIVKLDALSLDLWGFQAEVGSFATSYIPTTSAEVTRAADVASITGSNFSSWYNQSEGTLFQNCISRAPIGGPGGSNAGVGMLVTNSTTGASIGFFRRADSTSLEISVYTGSVTSAFFSNASQWPQNIASKAALAYKTNDFAASANGLTVQTDTLGTVPTATQLDIGQMSTATYNRIGGGTFSRLTYYPNRLPDTTLQALTKL